MKIKEIILEFADRGLNFSITFIAAYMLAAYPIATGINIRQLIKIHTDNTLFWIGAGFLILWYISIFFSYSTSKICKKYGVAIIK